MKSLLFQWGHTVSRVVSWPNVLSARRKSVLPRKRGRWLAERTRVVRGRNSQSDSISVVGKPSDRSLTSEKSRLGKALLLVPFFIAEDALCSRCFERIKSLKEF
jgi:hypothetical protein